MAYNPDAATKKDLEQVKISRFYGTGATASVESGGKVWEASVKNTASGLITVAIPSNVAFANINNIQLTAMGGNSAVTMPIAAVQSNTLTQLVIRVIRGRQFSVAGSQTLDSAEPCTDTTVTIYIRVAGT